MDKLEYKHLAEQIQELIRQSEYAEAAAIADKIDWRRVRSVMMLGTISDLYKINCRYEDARDIMLLAYDRKPENRQICYSLCELYIKTGEMVEAVEFYKEFVQLAPKDPGRYILQYKLYEANDVSLEERIEVLEELKKHEYQEKWMYELAYLYHRLGLATKCIEECDEIVLWFGSGKYVTKALELKMLHAPLTDLQQQKYENRFNPVEEPVPASEDEMEETVRELTGELPRELTGENTGDVSSELSPAQEEIGGQTRAYDPQEVRRAMQGQAARQQEELDIQVKTMDVSQYNTMNLQAELAAGLKEVLEQESGEMNPVTRAIMAPMMEEDTGALDMPAIEEINEEDLEPEEEQMEGSEVYLEEEAPQAASEQEPGGEEPALAIDWSQGFEWQSDSSNDQELLTTGEEPSIGSLVMEQMRRESMSQLEQEAMVAQPPEKMAKVLTQESDGQIRLVMPESKNLEKQITGQISIEDIRAEWERMKQESREKQEEEVRQQVLRQTGKMFTEFEEALRDNILEQMEKQGDPSLLELIEGSDASKEDTASGKEKASWEEQEDSQEWEMEALGDEVIPEEEEEEPAAQPDTVEKEPEAETVEEAEAAEEEPEVEAEADTAEAEPEEAAEAVPETEELETAEEELEVEAEAETVEAETVEAEPEEAAEAVPETEEAETAEAEPEAEAEATEEEPEVEAEAEPEEAAEAVPETEELETAEEEPEAEEGDETAEDEPEEAAEAVPETKEPETAEEAAEDPEDIETEADLEKRLEEDALWEDEAEEPQQSGATGESEEEAVDKQEAREETEEPEKTVQDQAPVRPLTREERELYNSLVQGRAAREQLVRAIDNISMAAYTGNLIITGEGGLDTMTLAKNIIREIQFSDSNFSGKVAKISGHSLNNRTVSEIVENLKNGALIIEKATEMNESTVQDLYRNLQQENYGLIVVMEDDRKAMNRFLKTFPQLRALFTARMDMQPLSDDALASFGRQYARENEFSIDALGMLALHTRIDEMQTAEHAVTIMDVKNIMDDAMYHASRKTLAHFFDILLGKRYDEEDMVILTEKDFG